MIKGKKVAGVVGLLTLLVVSSCNPVKPSDEGYVLTLTNPNGEKINYTTDQLFGRYKGNATGVAMYYEAANEVVIRNEVNLPENAGDLAEIMQKAKNRVDDIKESAESAAKNNGTKYDKELESLLSSNHAEDLADLEDIFAYQGMKDKVLEKYHKDNKIEMLIGSPTYTGYLDKMLPYHVKHILVKVSDGSSQFYDGTISETDAKSISSVMKRLAIRKSNESFGSIAQQLSQDEGSAAKYGDLGVMSKATGFVNEFKLGVYAYDALFNQSLSPAAKAKLKVPADAADYFENTLGLGEIPYELTSKLDEYAAVVKDEDGNLVNDGKSLYYPRNIYYNLFLNKHNISVITPTKTDGTEDPAYASLVGFTSVAELGGRKVLTDENGRVILVVRAGASGSYEGIHFIVVERGALVETVNGVSLKDYYTTEIPGTSAYPKDGLGNDLSTYVNFLKSTTKNYKERADYLTSEIKNFDPYLQGHIFLTLMDKQNVSFVDTDLGNKVRTYLQNQVDNSTFNQNLSYLDTWTTYIQRLELQEWERTNRLIAETCATDFLTAGSSVEYNVGGTCYVKK